MNNRTKYIILSCAALSMSVLPPLIATVMQFPIWIEKSSEATVSGIALILIFFSCLPFYRAIINYFRSPSAPVVWIVICVLMYIMKSIAEQMFVVACVGAVSNLIGVLFFRLRNKYRDDE